MDSSGRFLKWTFEFSEYDIQYKLKTTIKAQVLVDFILEISYEEEEVKEKETWLLEVDGSSDVNGYGAEIIMTSPKENIYEYTIKFVFLASNNEAEYEAVIAGLRMYMCIVAGAKNVSLKTDS